MVKSKIGLSFGIIILFVLSAVAPMTTGINLRTSIIRNDGNILYVGGSGEGNYSSIRDAIDDASDGDTVFVYDDSSPYYEGVSIRKSINLIGEDRNTTVINAGGITSVIYVANVNWVNISGFTIENGSYDEGIMLYNSSYGTIAYNNVFNNTIGITIRYWSDNNIIKGNTIKSSKEYGVEIRSYSNNNIVIENTIINCEYDGIYIGLKADNNTLQGNKISLNYNDGIRTVSDNTTIINNVITSNYDGILIGGHSSYNSIFNNIISNNTYGIYLWYTNSYNSIKGNSISSNTFGIISDSYSNNNSIYHNNFLDNTDNAYDTCDNNWDDGKYGNFWDDYEDRYPNAKPKLFKPWMWDTPYEISGGDNLDMCPLVNRWANSVSRDISMSKSTNNILLLRILERFPLLQKLIQNLRL